MSNSSHQRFATDSTMPPLTAEVIAFPQAKRVHAVARLAERMARAKSRDKGEDLLASAIRRQRAAMARKGVAPNKIILECARLESAVRARLWNIIFVPPPNDAA